MQSFDVVIIGSGAGAYATADRLLSFGCKNVAIVTEGSNFGTSRNAGSDKQTYYKLSCTDLDSPIQMAKDLSFGGSMHKDTAYIEASNSLRCFLHLVEAGVPFPQDEYGRFVGYKTDHDSASRGTSCGPLTSKYMTEHLEKRIMGNENLTYLDNSVVVKIVKSNDEAVGLICLQKLDNKAVLTPIKAKKIVLATGGAAGIYRDSVYPYSQSGALGLAVDAGCDLQNVNEWQYGIASTKVRWNLSGSYQQVMPKYYSVDEDGNTYDFLTDFFKDDLDACNNVFLKGYQWPFDSRKTKGSSVVDLAVNDQTKKGRKVYMDFRVNPNGYDFEKLNDETRDYLIKANAVDETPIKRLEKLNQKSIDFYTSKGIDLYTEPLEIAVCAQHMNGGVAVDTDWQTSVKNLFTVGEAAGTFGVYRPGGSALNSTQVGALRTAQRIMKENLEEIRFADDKILLDEINEQNNYVDECVNTENKIVDFSGMMSDFVSHSRIYEKAKEINELIKAQLDKKYYHIESKTFANIRKLYKYRDALLSQKALCTTLIRIIPLVGGRGGAMCLMDGKELSEDVSYREKVIITRGEDVIFEQVRDFPDTDFNFETVWNSSTNQH